MVGSLKDRNEATLEPSSIGGDRRSDRRYGLRLDLQWKLLHRRRVLDSGTGRTRDLSSGGLLLEIGRSLPAESVLQISIAWPALLHGVSPLKLVAIGRVVRSNRTSTAIRMTQHEFRTAGSTAEHPKSPASERAPASRLEAPRLRGCA